MYTLLEAYVTPPLLNAESCAFSDDEINWQLLELAAEEMGPELLLNERRVCLLVKERLEEAQELLILFFGILMIMVQNGE